MSGFISSFANISAKDLSEFAEPPILNKVGYIPVLGTISGACRIIMGLAKAIFAGLASIGIRIFAPGPQQAKWNHRFTNGLLDIGRGIIELVPFSGFFTKAHDADPMMTLCRVIDRIHDRANGW